jgi:hypothetical protein
MSSSSSSELSSSSSISSESSSSSSEVSSSSSTSSESSSRSSESSSSSSTCYILVTEDYTKGDYDTLPADDTNLEVPFICEDYTIVALNDNRYVPQVATDEYAMFLFKNQHDSNNHIIKATCIAKSDKAPFESTVYLQIYNHHSGLWETMDSNGSKSANIEFTLIGYVNSNLSDYYDGSNWVSWRVYQDATY